MSINIPTNYPVLEKASSKIINPLDHHIKPQTRKYNVKKSDDYNETHNNHNSKWYNNPHDNYHRSRPLTMPRHDETTPKYRYKSYDYLPLKYNSDQYKSSRLRDGSRDITDFSNNFQYYDRNDNKFPRSYNFPSARQYSSNDELDNSNLNDYSSENSKRFSLKSSNHNYGGCMKTNTSRMYDNYKPMTEGLGDYEDYKHRKHDGVYNTHSNYNSTPQRPKRTSFTNNFSNYANNNRSDVLTTRLSSPRVHSSDKRSSRNREENDDNYCGNNDDMYNKNPMSLKSTYRKNEDVPHSGTRLEHHRKQMDKYCSGNGNYRESHNSDRGSGHYNSGLGSKNNNVNKFPLPPSSKCNNIRKSCISEKHSYDDRKPRFSTPQRSNRQCYEGVSDNESGYFENCRNSNNECRSKISSVSKNQEKEYLESMSECSTSSSTHLSYEKPTENIYTPLSSLKNIRDIKPLDSSLNNISKSRIRNPPKKDDTKDSTLVHRRSCRSSGHQKCQRHH